MCITRCFSFVLLILVSLSFYGCQTAPPEPPRPTTTSSQLAEALPPQPVVDEFTLDAEFAGEWTVLQSQISATVSGNYGYFCQMILMRQLSDRTWQRMVIVAEDIDQLPVDFLGYLPDDTIELISTEDDDLYQIVVCRPHEPHFSLDKEFTIRPR